MAASTVEKPPGLKIETDNWFHEGWLFAILGIPRKTFNDPDHPVRDLDVEAWELGYDTAKETMPSSITIDQLQKMIALYQITPKEMNPTKEK